MNERFNSLAGKEFTKQTLVDEMHMKMCNERITHEIILKLFFLIQKHSKLLEI